MNTIIVHLTKVVDLTFSEPRKEISYELFWWFLSYEVLEQIQLCCQDGNFGQLL